MNGRVADLVFYGIVILLPLSALIARRVPMGQTLRMALAWIGIFAVGLLAVSQRHRLPSLTQITGDQRVSGTETRIAQSGDGHFWAEVAFGDVRRRMLIDSGATTTALSVDTARALGLDLDASPFPVIVQTANGSVQARTATVQRLSIGTVTATDLPVVVASAFGTTDVLGMNFLSRLGSWRVENRTLILSPRQP